MRAFWISVGAIGFALALGLHSCSDDDESDTKKGSKSDVKVKINGEGDVEKIDTNIFQLTLDDIGDEAGEVSISVNDDCALMLLYREGDDLTAISDGDDVSGDGDVILIFYKGNRDDRKLEGCKLIVGDTEIPIEFPEAEGGEGNCTDGEPPAGEGDKDKSRRNCGAMIMAGEAEDGDAKDDTDDVIVVNVGMGFEGAEDSKVKVYASNDGGETWAMHSEEVDWGAEEFATGVSWNHEAKLKNLALLNFMAGEGEDEKEVWLPVINWQDAERGGNGGGDRPSGGRELLNLTVEDVADGELLMLKVLDHEDGATYTLQEPMCDNPSAEEGERGLEKSVRLLHWADDGDASLTGSIGGVEVDADGIIKDVYALIKADATTAENCRLKVVNDGADKHGSIVFNVGERDADNNFSIASVSWEDDSDDTLDKVSIALTSPTGGGGNWDVRSGTVSVKIANTEHDDQSLTDGKVEINITPCPMVDADNPILVRAEIEDASTPPMVVGTGVAIISELDCS